MKTTPRSLAGQFVDKVKGLWKRRRDLDRRRGRRAKFQFESLENRALLAGDLANLPLSNDDAAALVTVPQDNALSRQTFLANYAGEGEAGEGEAAVNDLVAFAKALTTAGVKIYGAAWDATTTAQKELFEDGAKYLTFIDVTNPDHTPNSLAQAANNTLGRNITTYPTWEFSGGQFLEGTQTLAAIAAKAGIAIPQGNLPSFAAISNVTLKAGSPLWISLDGYDPNNSGITYSASSDNSALVATQIPTGERSAKITVDGYGSMTFHLFESLVPRVTDHFITLAQSGQYTNSASNPVEFYRIAKATDNSDFVIQGGRQGVASTLGQFDDQFSFDLQHNQSGLLSMAKSTDDTNDGEFFVTGNATRFLDFNHSIFGKITQGDDIRAAIQHTRATGDGAPPVDIKINNIQIFTDTENGVLMLKAPEGMTGTTNVTVTATDADGHTFSQTFQVNVIADDHNGAPFLSDIAPVSTPIDTPVTITLQGHDVEGNVNYYDAVKPTGVTIPYTLVVDHNTGAVTITPPAGYVGVLPVIVGVRGVDQTGTNDQFDTQLINVNVVPGVPTSVDLLASSDSGLSNSDNLTNASAWDIKIDGVTAGASVKLFEGSTLLAVGQATGTSITLTVQPTIIQQLGEGAHTITATQTVNDATSGASAPLTITYDATGPAAFTSTAPTTAMVGTALTYDAQSADEGSVAYQLVSPPAGATINASTGVLTWTPTAAQVGVQTFEIHAVDGAGNATVQALSIDVAAQVVPQAGIFLFLTKPDGSPLTTLATGDNFILKVGVMDVRNAPLGVFSAFMDVAYDSSKASVTGPITFGNTYATSRSGDTSTPGLIDEVGGVAGSTQLGQGLFDLFSVPMTATGSGLLEFTTNPADNVPAHYVLVYGNNTAVPNDAVQFGTASISVDLTFAAIGDVFNVDEDSTNFTLNPLANDTTNSGSGDVLTITSVGATNHGGTVSIAGDGKTLLYTPAPNFNGQETFTYTVSNQSGATDTATINVQVHPVNDPPQGVDDTYSVVEGSGETLLTVLGNDIIAPDTGETLKVTAVSVGSQGGTITVGPSGNSVSYVPKANFIGTETFTYTLSDGNGGTATANVTVNVTSVGNHNPTAVNDVLTVAEDSSNNIIDVLANDSFAPDEDETLTIASVATPTRGGTAVIENGKIKYTPAANFQGRETFTYTISDGNGGTASALVEVTVTNSNDPPTATNDTFNAFKNTTATFDVLANDTSSPDPTENLIVGTVTQGAHGTVAISADGKQVTYTPTSGYTGADTFTYTVRDPGGLESTGTVNVTVLEFVPSSLSGYVYFDVNNNGLMDPGEAPIVGAVVTLTGTDSGGANVNVPAAVTDSTGKYTFGNLTPGNYKLTETQPAFVEDGIVTVGSQGGTSLTNTITAQLAQGVDGTGNNFGEMSRQVELITIRDFFSSRVGGHLLVTQTGAGSTYSTFGAAWNGYTAGSITPAGNSQLHIEFTNPQGQRVGTTIALSDPRVIVLGTQTNSTLYRLNGKPADFNFAVVAPNTPPTISDTTDKSTAQGDPVNVNFTVGDAETAVAGLTVTATSSNTTLVPLANLVLGGSGANRTLAITPVAGQSGTATITLTVSDASGGTASDTFVVTVAPAVNNPPTISDVQNKTSPADTAIANVPFTIGDVETPAASLTVSATSSNTTLVPTANITLGGSGANRTVTVTPAAGQIGSATITLTVTDASGVSSSDSFLVTFTAVGNTPPTIGAIADQTTAAGVAISDLAFTVGDAETAAAALTVTAVSGNTDLVPTANITFGGTGANRTVTVTPAAGQSGTAVITLTVNDGTGGTATEVFTVTVTPAANTPPTISDTTDLSAVQDTDLDLAFTVGDAETAPGALTVTATSSNEALVTNAGLTLGGSGADRTLSIVPVAGQTGTTTITLTVTDASGVTATDTFVLTYTATANGLPTISGIGDQTIAQDASLTGLAFTVGDAETAVDSLTVTASSSNTALVPNGNITFSGTGANRTVTITPAAGQSGATTITLTVDDGNGGTATETFDVTVTPAVANTDPTISSIADQSTTSGNAIADLAFTVGDAETDAGSLTFTVASTNLTLVPLANITFGGSGANRTVSIAPVAGETGTATITLTVHDGNGGLANESFLVTVAPAANTLPTIGAIADQATADITPLTDLAFTVDDAETDAGSLVVTAASSNTALIPTGNIVLGGSGANRTVTITPVLGQSGTATITLTVDDGTGGTATESFDVVVTSDNEQPTIGTIADQTTAEATPLVDIPFTVNDAETDASSLVVTAASSDLTLIPLANVTFGGSGANRTVSIAPAANQSGTATITLTVSDDDGGTATTTFLVEVTANGQPTISEIADQTTSEDVALTDIPFTVGDAETDPATLTVTAQSSDETLIPLANITFGGSGANRTVTITPAFAQTGTATITLTVSDGTGGETTTTFTVEVTANTPPTIDAITDQSTPQDTPLADVPVTIGDASTPAASLVLAGTSDNQTLVPDGNITFGGSGANRTVTITPAAGEIGTATITLTVTDDNGATATETFVVTVTAPNVAPTATADSVNATEDSEASPTGNVLTNDDDGGDGGALSVVSVDGVMANVGMDVLGTYGTFHIEANGDFTYTLDNNNVAVDALNDLDELIDIIAYSITDGFGTASSTLSVHIQGVTDSP